jgi:hypothetical protein
VIRLPEGDCQATLSRSRRCTIYQNLSVPEVVEQALRAHDMEGPDFEFRLSHQYPVRELITQWRETDLEFIQRILSETGIWFRQGMNDVTGLDLTIFGDSQLHYIFNGVLPYHEPSGLYDGAELCCWGVRTRHNVVTGKVSTRDYHPRSASEPMDTSVSVRSPAVTTGEVAQEAIDRKRAADFLGSLLIGPVVVVPVAAGAGATLVAAGESLTGACWYTILGTPWLEKLGGAEKLKHRLARPPEISLLPYNNGVILKAGELPPALGEMKVEGLPELLVKVNQIIRPVRYDGHNGLHFYSEYEGLQFEKASSMKWFARFDEASTLLDKAEIGKSYDPVRITRWTDETAPYAGQWAAIVNGTTEYIQIREGQKMPAFEDKYGKKHRARWSLLKRDDKGSVFVMPE